MSSYRTPEFNLWIAVLATAVRDLAHPSARTRDDAKRFFRSSYLSDICAMVDLDPDRLRAALKDRPRLLRVLSNRRGPKPSVALA